MILPIYLYHSAVKKKFKACFLYNQARQIVRETELIHMHTIAFYKPSFYLMK